MAVKLPEPQPVNGQPMVVLMGVVASVFLASNLVSLLDAREAMARENRVLATDEPTPEPAPEPEPKPEVALESALGIDYSRLQEFLWEGSWKEANEETLRVMLKAANREETGVFTSESIEEFPCKDLRTIDQLWVKYSDGRFGFSVQRQIYQDSGGKFDGNYPGHEIYGRFADESGWRKFNGRRGYPVSLRVYDDLTFNTSAPQGHLPAVYVLGMDAWWYAGLYGFTHMLKRCEL